MSSHGVNSREVSTPGADEIDVAMHEVDRSLPKPRVSARSPAAALPQRVLLVASAGGHWIELARLSRAFDDAECLFLSTASGLKSPTNGAEVIAIRDFSRHSPLVGLGALIRLYREMRRFDPDVVFSTGAAPGALAILLGKLRGARTIWVDSLANYDGLSLSARFVRPFCDRMVTQWPHLESTAKGIACWGRII
jgi:hypothetical protein